MKKLTHYKDTVTGQYVKKSTWRRNKAHGGTRYKRTYERYVKPTEPRKQREITPGPSQANNVEYFITLDYRPKRKFQHLLLDISFVGPRNASASKILTLMKTKLGNKDKWVTNFPANSFTVIQNQESLPFKEVHRPHILSIKRRRGK